MPTDKSKTTLIVSLVCITLFTIAGCESRPAGNDVFRISGLGVQQQYTQEQTPLPQIASPKIASSQIGAPQIALSLQHENIAAAGLIVRGGGSANLLKKISAPERYKTIVLLAPTAYKTAGAGIFTYEKEGVLAGKGFKFENGLLQKIMSSGVAASLGAVPSGSSWNNALPGLLAAKFTAARFILISVSGESSVEEMQKLEDFLYTNLPEESLVLSVSGFEKSDDQNLDTFTAEFINTVLMQCDTTKFNELPAENTKALEVLAGFIGKQKSCSEMAKDWAGNTLQILYGFGGRTSNVDQAQNMPVYLVSFGDVMLGRFVRTLMDANGLDYPFEKMTDYYLKSNDILLANLEGPIAQNAIKTTKAIAFRFMPDVAPILKKYYFDVLDLANNHMYDMGAQGYTDTKDALTAQGIAYFGDPKGINADSVRKIEVRGQKIVFLGLEEVVYKIDDEKAVKEIKRLAGEGYKVIPVVHWGVEYTHKPNNRQKELAHKFIDAGATMVIGHHPHVVQAFEEYNGHPIFYSLGNAVFDQYFSADTQEGLSIGAIISNDSIRVFLFPLKIKNSQMILMNEDERKKFLERFVTYGEYGDDMKNSLLAGSVTLAPQSEQKKAE